MSAVPLKQSEIIEHKSKHGFHPCDYETFKKLKALHKVYWETLRSVARWFRWNAKYPNNRVIKKRIRDADGKVLRTESTPWEEPKYFPIFGIPDRKYQWWTIPEHVDDLGIIDAYQTSRTPQPQNCVTPLKLSLNEINRFYDELMQWEKSN